MRTLIKLHNDGNGMVEIVSDTMQTIILPLEVYAELTEYTTYYGTEVSGVGLIEKEESKAEIGTYQKKIVHSVLYHITEIFLPSKQRNSYGSTEIEETAISEIVTRLIKEGKDPAMLRLHWHSHVNMNTFHSGVDEENYQGLDNKDFLVSLVINKRREVLGRVDVYTPVTVAFINIPVFVSVPSLDTVEKKILINIGELDKYIKEEDVRKGINRFTGHQVDKDKQVRVYDKFDIDVWRREQKIKKKARRALNISDEKAIKFETCKHTTIKCGDCPDVMDCVSYQDEIDRRLAGRGRHFETVGC